MIDSNKPACPRKGQAGFAIPPTVNKAIPFGPEQFLDVFEACNRFVFPAQAILFLAGCLAVFAVVARAGQKSVPHKSAPGLRFCHSE
jgi:hypothetical protein